MLWLFAGLAVIVLLMVGATLALYCLRIDRALTARAELRAQQRQAEAAMQRTMQHTVAQLFEAARRRQ